jgi:hypothetical protein
MSPYNENVENTAASTILTEDRSDSPKNAGKPTNQSKEFLNYQNAGKNKQRKQVKKF